MAVEVRGGKAKAHAEEIMFKVLEAEDIRGE